MAFLRALTQVILLSLFLSGCGAYKVTDRLTVVVDTPDGQKSASSVLEARFWPAIIEQQHPYLFFPTYEMQGEAVALEVTPGRYLFVTFKDLRYPWEIFLSSNWETVKEFIIRAEGMLGQKQVLKPEQYPWLVTFGDLKVPTSAKRVEPGNLAATFGPGYRLVEISMTITDELVTEGRIEKLLKWLPGFKTQLDGDTLLSIDAPNRVANSLSPLSFKQGKKQ